MRLVAISCLAVAAFGQQVAIVRQAARLGFASALALAIAVISFPWYRPAAMASDDQVARRVDVAVQKAVADTEARQARRVAEFYCQPGQGQ